MAIDQAAAAQPAPAGGAAPPPAASGGGGNGEKDTSKWSSGLIVRLVITLVMLVLVFWWLWIVSTKLGKAPVTSSDGTVIYDEFARAKDILIAVLPLLTLALGYWFGAQGADKADQTADDAKKDATAAHQQVTEILNASSETDLLTKARKANPRAFGLPGGAQ